MGGLRANLVGAIVTSTAALVLTVILIEDPLVEHRVVQSARAELGETADAIAEGLEGGGAPDALADAEGARRGVWVLVRAADGRVIGDSAGRPGGAGSSARIEEAQVQEATERGEDAFRQRPRRGDEAPREVLVRALPDGSVIQAERVVSDAMRAGGAGAAPRRRAHRAARGDRAGVGAVAYDRPARARADRGRRSAGRGGPGRAHVDPPHRRARRARRRPRSHGPPARGSHADSARRRSAPADGARRDGRGRARDRHAGPGRDDQPHSARARRWARPGRPEPPGGRPQQGAQRRHPGRAKRRRGGRGRHRRRAQRRPPPLHGARHRAPGGRRRGGRAPRRDPPAARRPGAPGLRRQREPRAAHAADRGPRLRRDPPRRRDERSGGDRALPRPHPASTPCACSTSSRICSPSSRAETADDAYGAEEVDVRAVVPDVVRGLAAPGRREAHRPRPRRRPRGAAAGAGERARASTRCSSTSSTTPSSTPPREVACACTCGWAKRR